MQLEPAMTITRKFTAVLVAGLVLVHAVGAAIQIVREVGLVHRDLARHEQLLGQALSHAVERTWRTRGEAEALELVQNAVQDSSNVSARWVWLGPNALEPHAPRAPGGQLAPLTTGARVVVRQPGADGLMYSYIPVSVPDGRAGAIEISESLSDEYHYIRQTVVTASLTALALVVLCAILAWVLGSRLIGQPIAVLVRQARRVGGGDLSGRLKLERKDEIGQLALEMDRMCDGLESAGARVQSETRARLAALEQLRHADRLTTVGTLASGVAHELGTPLNVIAGHAELLREDPATSTGALENLSVISRQCARMTQIIRQLLDFSRRGLSSDTVSDVRVVALETLRMVDPLARARRIEIAFESGNEASMAKIGFEPMQQVLTNVVLNGLQAMPKGGTLRVVLSREPPTDAGDPEYVRIDVKDSGHGMDDVTRKRVFEPFFTTKEVGEGTGLGLSVAHGIVKDHRGRIDVVSEIGSGTEFLIRVPAGSA